MGGFVSVPQVSDLAMPGRVFRVIPATGVLTDGDDTLIGSWITSFSVSGGQGDDLLVLDYSGRAVRVELDIALGFIGIYDADYRYLANGTVGDFERFRLTGGALEDTLRAGWDGGATLSGGAGDDLIELRGGDNAVRGGAGDDSIHGATLSDTVSGGTGTDVLFVDLTGASSGVHLRGGDAFANWNGFEHYAGTLTALDDTLEGGALRWDAYGGAGSDLVVLDYRGLSGASLVFDAAGVTGDGLATVQFHDGDGQSLEVFFLQQFERYSVGGTARGDFFRGGIGDDVLRGQGGVDTLSGGGGRDTLNGGAGNDFLTGNLDAGSVLSGGAGDDWINAWRADDTIAGGSGTDTVYLELWESAAPALIDLAAASPIWRGVEAIFGALSRHDDVFRTTAVTGSLNGAAGVDLLAFDYGRSGADGVLFRFGLLEVSSGGSVLSHRLFGFERFEMRGSEGADTLIGDDRADVLEGLAGDDWLGGRGGHDHLHGGSGRDTLFGGAGDDTLDGGSGSDTLEGSTGNDVLTGGLGRDTFWFRGPNLGNDIITDFAAGLDRIVMDPLFQTVAVEQSGADVLIDILGQTLRVQNAGMADVLAAIVYTDLVLG